MNLVSHRVGLYTLIQLAAAKSSFSDMENRSVKVLIRPDHRPLQEWKRVVRITWETQCVTVCPLWKTAQCYVSFVFPGHTSCDDSVTTSRTVSAQLAWILG
ncbi:hypothetical protein JOB18_036556 [Solea senegalensis]|uniref:Uncharacterized protein n=1 Tax=Solea senegalensis TaxID=28829 RepID=A0AAV6QRP2_SOLSE|nr:hypothetical protein JOB18_036556 [Solea senegalensis]